MITRRQVLAAATGPLLLRATGGVTVTSALASCGGRTAGVEVFVMWSGGELAAFRETLQHFHRESGLQVRVVPVGEQVNELLQARIDTDNPPDLAIVPLPGLIRDYAKRGHVRDLGSELGKDTPEGLRELVTMDDGMVAGLWVKAAHKSLFWHRGDISPPKNWAELVGLVTQRAFEGRTPLAIGAADGWVVSDWFENMLIAVGGGETYDQLARGQRAWKSPHVTTALEELARLWSVPDAFPGGAERALLTQYEESVAQVFATCRADLVFEGDFVGSVVSRFTRKPAKTFFFPPLSTDQPLPPVVGGDVAARFTDSRKAEELIRWLAEAGSMRPWISQGGFLSPNKQVPLDWYPNELTRKLAVQLYDANEVRFDLSDQLTGRLGGGQGRGMWRILQDFFGAVAAGQNQNAAVRLAQKQLDAASRGQS
ncbi:MAG TPA: ABC transporter substrate-binding protein [Micromonosporaceae bacterium]|nr:ABC transporter substrate-binding protein [Micromonosporaceae bacterium]